MLARWITSIRTNISMSYNGIGLQSARGSGTSGHIQTNLGKQKEINKDSYHHRQQQKRTEQKLQDEEQRAARQKEARTVLKEELDSQRSIELECSKLRDTLEDDSEAEDVIEGKINALRERLLKEANVYQYVPLREKKERGDNQEDDQDKEEEKDATAEGKQANIKENQHNPKKRASDSPSGRKSYRRSRN